MPEVISVICVRRWPRSRVIRYGASALVCASLLIGVEKPSLPVTPAAAEAHPVAVAADIHQESADDGSAAPRAMPIREKAASEEHPVAEAAAIPEKSENDERPHRRSWLRRALSKVVHPRSSQDGEGKR